MKLRVGSRRSPLARAQTEQTCSNIAACCPGLEWSLVTLETSGDRIHDRPLRQAGGKELFVKELDEALLAGRIDCAVHSLKDVPGELPEGLIIAAVPERADPRDLLISMAGWAEPAEIPAGSRVGTTSLRRAAQLLACNTGVRVEMLRGNVETRLRRIAESEFAATFLAAAGLQRLGRDAAPACAVALDPFHFVPAPGQGALCIVARAEDRSLCELLAGVEHEPSRRAVDAERSCARVLGGSCYLPLGAHAEPLAKGLRLIAFVASSDGSKVLRREATAPVAEAEKLGRDLGQALLDGGAREILSAIEGLR